VVRGGRASDDARVVHQNVEPALPGDRVGDETLDLRTLAQIRSQGVAAAAAGGDFRDDGCEAGGVASIHDQIRSGFREGEGHGAAQSARRPRDQRHPTVQAERLLQVTVHRAYFSVETGTASMSAKTWLSPPIAHTNR
jgi:hypothetical protein